MDNRHARNFDWDEGNSYKNRDRHRVSRKECEAVFFHRPLVVREDIEHSRDEDRFYALGRTDEGRRLFVVFTFRGDAIRVISARDMTTRERRAYADAEEDELEHHS